MQRRREECERKARRGEMDPRLEYTFQLMIDATGLPRHEIMDHVFEGNMLDDINQLFLPNMRKRLIWFYQDVQEEPDPAPAEKVLPPLRPTGGGVPPPSAIAGPSTTQPPPEPKVHKKLFLTEGAEKLTGICIYMFRINVTKQLPEEGFQKDLYCGVIDAEHIGLVTSVERIMELIFMEALAYPALDVDDDENACPMIKNQLLPGLRSFCSSLRVCEEVCKEEELLEIDEIIVSHLDSDGLREAAFTPETIKRLEERTIVWIKKVSELLYESEQLRQENHSSGMFHIIINLTVVECKLFFSKGPQDELEYWKKRAAQFSQLVKHLQQKEVMRTILALHISRSRVMKIWREIDKKITMCYNEARDNAKFIEAMEKCCHSLYLDEPVNIAPTLISNWHQYRSF